VSRPDTERDWKEEYFANVVNQPEVQARAWDIAEEMREPEDPELTLADLHCARRYLRACFLNSSERELSGMTLDGFAAWWARGILGAARYRVRGGGAEAVHVSRMARRKRASGREQ
jgi:hypothetical protein